MKFYSWILFDVDETLLHFDAFTGLKRLFSPYNIEFTVEDYREYQTVNNTLWKKYQNGNVPIEQVLVKRFDNWANKLDIPAQNLADDFINIMIEIDTPMEGALNLLNVLKGKTKLGIITNGTIDTQHTRLKLRGFKDYFDIIVISEEVGVAKPNPNIFTHTLSLMGNPSPEHVLMVGDNLEADILGGNNVGLDTCWLNSNNRPSLPNIIPTYQIKSLMELESLMNKSFNNQQTSLEAQLSLAE